MGYWDVWALGLTLPSLGLRFHIYRVGRLSLPSLHYLYLPPCQSAQSPSIRVWDGEGGREQEWLSKLLIQWAPAELTVWHPETETRAPVRPVHTGRHRGTRPIRSVMSCVRAERAYGDPQTYPVYR